MHIANSDNPVNLTMEQFILENGIEPRICEMEEEFKFGQIIHSTKDTGKMTKRMVMGN